MLLYGFPVKTVGRCRHTAECYIYREARLNQYWFRVGLQIKFTDCLVYIVSVRLFYLCASFKLNPLSYVRTLETGPPVIPLADRIRHKSQKHIGRLSDTRFVPNLLCIYLGISTDNLCIVIKWTQIFILRIYISIS